MDRAETISLLYKFYGAGLTREEGEEVIKSYCLEKGKKEKDIERLFLALMVVPEYKVHCIDCALRYYRQKHCILELYKQPGPLDVNRRQVILIY